jgi:hypothetical protein
MSLSFDSTHEYYMFDSNIYYCEDHDALIISQDRDCTNRILINGVTSETMLKFARKLVQDDLDKTLAKYEDKEVNKEDNPTFHMDKAFKEVDV